MKLQRVYTTMMFIVSMCTYASATSYKSFNFVSSTKSGNTFSNGTASITIGSPSAYVEVKALPGRLASGLIQVDYSNQIDYNEVLNFPSYDYYIGVQMHLFYDSIYYNLFCLKITIPVITMVNGVNVQRYRDSSDAYYCSLLSPYDSYSAPWNAVSNTLGSFRNGTSIYNPFIGIFSLFEICESTTSCDHSSTTKADLLTSQFNIYENYWDLTQGTSYDGFVSKNPCKRRQELNLSNVYFTHKSTDMSPFPTDQGWFILYYNSDIITDSIDLSDTHQYTVELELYPIEKYYNFKVMMNYGTSSQLVVSIDFKHSRCTYYYCGSYYCYCDRYEYYSYAYISGSNMSCSTTFNILAKNWYKIFISVAMQFNNQMTVSVYYKTLVPSTSTSNSVYQLNCNGYTNQNMPSGSTAKIEIFNPQSIIRFVKLYKWAINFQTLIDIGPYKYADNVIYNFQTSFNNNYFTHYNNISYTIDSLSNACNNFVSSQTQICADLSVSGSTTCKTGFTNVEYFCVDKCGDGSVQLHPQTVQCDDGNFKNGDGCNNACFIESGFECFVKTDLNNRSYCRLMCGNGNIDSSNNEQCDDGNVVDGDGCSKNCKVEAGYKCKTLPDNTILCYPNCGDGVRDTSPYVEDCDDGDNFDFDGCNHNCKVEFNFNCTYDNDKKADVCKTIYDPPVILNSTFDSKTNQITVNFDQTMLNQNVSLTDLTIDISGPNSPYAVSWSSNFINNSYQMSFTSTPILLGGIGEVITIQLIEVDRFKSLNKIPIKSSARFEFTVASLEPNQSTQAAGSGASYTFIITGLIAILVGVLTGGSIELMWSLANTLQIWVYFGMLNLYYSADLAEMYSYLKCANFDNPISDYTNSKFTTYLKFILNPVNDKFSNLGFKSTEIISNSLDKLFMILIMLLSLAVLYILRMFVRNKTNKFANFIKQKDIDFRYEGITRFFVEFILVISISNFINLVYGGFGDVFASVSYVLSVVILTMTLLLIIYFYAYPTIYYESICIYPDKNERHCLLFLEFKRDNIQNLLFYGNFAVHRVAFAFVVVCMKDFPINQCVCIAFLSLWILCKTFCVYKHALPNFLNTFNGIVLLFYSILLFMFISPANPNKILIAGYVGIGIIAVFFVLNWLLVLPIIGFKAVKSIYDYLKRKCCKQSPDNAARHTKPTNLSQINSATRNEENVSELNLEVLNEVKIYKIQPQKPKKDYPDTTPMFINALEEEKKEATNYPYLSQARSNFD